MTAGRVPVGPYRSPTLVEAAKTAEVGVRRLQTELDAWLSGALARLSRADGLLGNLGTIRIVGRRPRLGAGVRRPEVLQLRFRPSEVLRDRVLGRAGRDVASDADVLRIVDEHPAIPVTERDIGPGLRRLGAAAQSGVRARPWPDPLLGAMGRTIDPEALGLEPRWLMEGERGEAERSHGAIARDWGIEPGVPFAAQVDGALWCVAARGGRMLAFLGGPDVASFPDEGIDLGRWLRAYLLVNEVRRLAGADRVISTKAAAALLARLAEIVPEQIFWDSDLARHVRF